MWSLLDRFSQRIIVEHPIAFCIVLIFLVFNMLAALAYYKFARRNRRTSV